MRPVCATDGKPISRVIFSNISFLRYSDDAPFIGEMIDGAKRYYLQSYRPGPTVGWGAESPVGPPQAEVLRMMAASVSVHVCEVGIRGYALKGG